MAEGKKEKHRFLRQPEPKRKLLFAGSETQPKQGKKNGTWNQPANQSPPNHPFKRSQYWEREKEGEGGKEERERDVRRRRGAPSERRAAPPPRAAKIGEFRSGEPEHARGNPTGGPERRRSRRNGGPTGAQRQPEQADNQPNARSAQPPPRSNRPETPQSAAPRATLNLLFSPPKLPVFLLRLHAVFSSTSRRFHFAFTS